MKGSHTAAPFRRAHVGKSSPMYTCNAIVLEIGKKTRAQTFAPVLYIELVSTFHAIASAHWFLPFEGRLTRKPSACDAERQSCRFNKKSCNG